MNLWVKRTGQLLVVALLLVSCEDDSFLLGFKNQNKKFQGLYKELILTNSIVFADSFQITDNLISNSLSGYRSLIGKYNDPILGSIEATSFTEIWPSIAVKLDASSVYDSATFQLYLDFYSIGLSDEHTEKFAIHRITEDTLSYYLNPSSRFTSRRYKANSSVGFDPTPIATASIKVNYDSLKKNLQKSSGYDTILAKAKLDDIFGQELFEVALNNPDSVLNKPTRFRWKFKGFAFVPDASSTAVLGYNPSNTLSKITLHYHTTENGEVKDTLERAFLLQGTSFHNLNSVRPGEYPTPEAPFVSTDPSYLAIQNGNPLLSKIDLTPYFSFIDTIDASLVLNSAQIVVESQGVVDGISPINAFELRVSKQDNHYYDYRIDEDSVFFLNYLSYRSNGAQFSEPVFTYLSSYLVNSDIISQQVAASLAYSKTNSTYSGFATRFFQVLFDTKDKTDAEKIRYLTFFPATNVTGYSNPFIGKTLDRTLLKKEVKLKLYYTLPNSSNF